MCSVIKRHCSLLKAEYADANKNSYDYNKDEMRFYSETLIWEILSFFLWILPPSPGSAIYNFLKSTMAITVNKNTPSAPPPHHEQTQSEVSVWRFSWFCILHSADTSAVFPLHLWSAGYTAVCQHQKESQYLCLQGTHSPEFERRQRLVCCRHPEEEKPSRQQSISLNVLPAMKWETFISKEWRWGL